MPASDRGRATRRQATDGTAELRQASTRRDRIGRTVDGLSGIRTLNVTWRRVDSPWSIRAASQPCWDNGESSCGRRRRPRGPAASTRRWPWPAGPTWPTTTTRSSSAAGWPWTWSPGPRRRGEADDLAGAIDDLRPGRADRAPRPTPWPRPGSSLADRVADEVRADLDAGEPAGSLERIEDLARHKIGGPALRRTREVAEAWQAALDEARRGEFGRAHEQLDRAERLAAGAGATGRPWPPPAATSRPGRRPPRPRSRRSTRPWPRANGPRSWPPPRPSSRPSPSTRPPARPGPGPGSRSPRSARSAALAQPRRAACPSRRRRRRRPSRRRPTPGRRRTAADGRRPRREVGADRLAQRPARPHRPAAPDPRPAPARPLAAGRVEAGPEGRFLLWVDAVGGYLVCLDDQIVLGRAGPDSQADVPLMGDLSRQPRHARPRRRRLRAPGPSADVRQRQAGRDRPPLRDGDVIRLGSTVELEFRQPSPVSATARLAIVSRHRLPLAVDGVLLMAETCIVGERAAGAHPGPGARRARSSSIARAAPSGAGPPGRFEVDGRACAARAPLTLQSSVLGDGFSFSLEPLGTQSV